MHEDLQKLINIAKESGELTSKQKEIILRKAEKLGEDVDEVELRLEQIDSSKPKHVASFKSKCPHCGAIIPDRSATVCPECGYVLFPLERKLIEIEKEYGDKSKYKVKAKTKELLNNYPVPKEKDNLLRFFNFTYARYLSETGGFTFLSLENEYLGKLVEAYNLMSQLYGDDNEVSQILKDYRFIKSKSQSLVKNSLEESALAQEYSSKARAKLKATQKKRMGCLAWTVVLSIISMILCMPLVVRDMKIANEVRELVEQHDFDGAKLKVKSVFEDEKRIKLTDDISVQEISYLISVGEFQQAEVVAASITDVEKRQSMIESVRVSSSRSIGGTNNDVRETPKAANSNYFEDNLGNEDNHTPSNEESNDIIRETNGSESTIETEHSDMLDPNSKLDENMHEGSNKETVVSGDFSIEGPIQVQVGEKFNLAFVLKGKERFADFSAKIPDGFSIVWGPQKGTSTSFVDGKSENVTTYTYILSADRVGNYSISAKADSQDQSFSFPEKHIEVIQK